MAAETVPIKLGDEAAAGPKAFRTVAGLVESALPPMLTLINHLRKESAFVRAVSNLGVDEAKIGQGLEDSIVKFQTAMKEFQTELKNYGVLATDELTRTTGGGTRKHQAKRRASTRGSYRRQRY